MTEWCDEEEIGWLFSLQHSGDFYFFPKTCEYKSTTQNPAVFLFPLLFPAFESDPRHFLFIYFFPANHEWIISVVTTSVRGASRNASVSFSEMFYATVIDVAELYIAFFYLKCLQQKIQSNKPRAKQFRVLLEGSTLTLRHSWDLNATFQNNKISTAFVRMRQKSDTSWRVRVLSSSWRRYKLETGYGYGGAHNAALLALFFFL